jgi:hypothetical protein
MLAVLLLLGTAIQCQSRIPQMERTKSRSLLRSGGPLLSGVTEKSGGLETYHDPELQHMEKQGSLDPDIQEELDTKAKEGWILVGLHKKQEEPKEQVVPKNIPIEPTKTNNNPAPLQQQLEGKAREGWVVVGLPGGAIKADQKNNNNQQLIGPLRQDGNYLHEDALPDAMAIISDLYDDRPVVVTQTIYITSKYYRSPTATGVMKGQGIKPTATGKQQPKKQPAKSTSRIKINTNLIKAGASFSIAPNDIYRGLHAQNSASSLTLSSMLYTFTMALGVIMIIL